MNDKRLLLIKMSSLGDLIHVFPAITELKSHYPTIKIDWVVEESFASVPTWHRHIDQVIPIALRRWRHNLLQSRKEIKAFLHHLRAKEYDMMIDAQGLIKSAMVGKLAKGGTRHGFDKKTLREPPARFLYDCTHRTDARHVVHQYCDLFSQSFGYNSQYPIDYAIQVPPRAYLPEPYVFCFHGTTWATKHWPVSYWERFIAVMKGQPYRLIFPWGNEKERLRASQLQQIFPEIIILPKHGLTELVAFIRSAAACVSVDTGLGHIAAACGTPVLFLFGPTAGDRVGGLLPSQYNLQAQRKCVPCHQKQCQFQKDAAFPPCHESLSPERVVEILLNQVLIRTNA